MLKDVSEAAFQQQLVDSARWMGWLAFHTYDSRKCEPGFPDLVLVHPIQRRVLFAEIKSETGRVRPDQLVWLGALMSCESVEVYTWRPRDIDRIHAILQARPGAGNDAIPPSVIEPVHGHAP